MTEIEKIKNRIKELFDKGDATELDRLYLLLNQLIADLSVKRTLLGLPESEPETEERLEMVDKDRLDREIEPEKPWRAKL
jgi:F0F1-type ATP synthase gamma subunit